MYSKSKEDITDISNSGLERIYTATGQTMKWSPYNHNHARSVNENLGPIRLPPEMNGCSKWITANDVFQHGTLSIRRQILSRDGMFLELNDMRQTQSRDELQLDIHCNEMWIDFQMCMTGDRARKIDHRRPMIINLHSNMKILGLCKVIPSSRSLTLIWYSSVTIGCRYADYKDSNSVA